MNSQNLQQMSTVNDRQQQQQQQQQQQTILMNANSNLEPTHQYTAKVYTQTSNCLPIDNTQSVIQQVGGSTSAQNQQQQQQQMNRMIDSYMNNQQQQINYDDTTIKDEFGKNKYSRGLIKIG
jgi:hypothetical protein